MKEKLMLVGAVMQLTCSTALCANTNLWISADFGITPTNDLNSAFFRLRTQNKLAFSLEHESYPSEFSVLATNLWDRLALLHGDLREKKMDDLPRVCVGFWILGDTTNQVEIQERMARNDYANKLRSYQYQLYDLEKRIGFIFANVASSEALASFPPAERNAIVSNLVETARLTPDEAARLGLTNVVEQVGGVSP